MTKYCGKIGFVKSTLRENGVHFEEWTEETYRGDVIRNSLKWSPGDSINSNISTRNQISIVTNSYMNENLQYLRYVEYAGALWTVESFDVQRPRIILTLGDIYVKDENPPPPEEPEEPEGEL